MTGDTAQYQDALCVLATGGGFATRTLYTNADETVLNLKKPVVMNGISVVVTAQDLLDRTVHVNLPTIEARLTAQELQRQFDQSRAGIFGGVLDLFVKVLAILPTITVEPKSLPRMADFALLGEAVYRVHGRKPGEFLTDYAVRRQDGVYRTLEASPVASAALAWLNNKPQGYDGTVKSLFEALTPFKPDGEAWPKSPKGFADSLRRIAPALRLIGINARISDRAGMHGYTCVLEKLPGGDISCGASILSSDVHQVHNVQGADEHHELHEHGTEVLSAKRHIKPTTPEILSFSESEFMEAGLL